MRAPRLDHPGADWLITNRGLGKRAVFETRDDAARFFEALAEVVELGLLEVFAFVLMTTHFHLLARSPVGEVSRAMKLALNRFVRGWNRTRKRGGPLFERRFHGVRITDPVHWETALRYIDLNPVRAGMCALPSDHPYGSARVHRYGDAPEWLSRNRVVATVSGFLAPQAYRPELYDTFACSVDADANAYLNERLASECAAQAPALLDLVRAASLRQQGWMEWKAALADGIRIGTFFLPPHEAQRAANAAYRLLSREKFPAAATQLRRTLTVGLLCRAAGQSASECAKLLGVARSTVARALRRHDAWCEFSPRYADVVARALQSAVRRALPVPSHPLALPPVVRY